MHLNFFGQGDCKDPLEISESDNLSMCVQGAQNHCSLNAEALDTENWTSKILPAQELENFKEALGARHPSLSFLYKWSNN